MCFKKEKQTPTQKPLYKPTHTHKKNPKKTPNQKSHLQITQAEWRYA